MFILNTAIRRFTGNLLLQFNSSNKIKIVSKTIFNNNRGQNRLITTNVNNNSLAVPIGTSVQVTRIFTAEDVEQFAKLSGDNNPIHFDDKFSVNFIKPVVHGALINGVISATIGTILPGPGSILLEQELRFPNPLYIGEQFITEIKISDKKRTIYFCNYECVTENGKKVVEGMAKILFDPSKFRNH